MRSILTAGPNFRDHLCFPYLEQRHKPLTEKQIITMKRDDVLLLVGNRSPLKVKLNVYFKNKAYRRRFDQNPLH